MTFALTGIAPATAQNVADGSRFRAERGRFAPGRQPARQAEALPSAVL